MNDSRPDLTSDPERIEGPPGASATTLVLFVMTAAACAVFQLLIGGFGLPRVSNPAAELRGNRLLPNELIATSELLYRNALVGAIVNIATGIALAVLALVFWELRHRLLHQTRRVAERRLWLVRLSVVALISTIVGGLAFEAIGGSVSYGLAIVMRSACSLLSFTGFVVSVVVLLRVGELSLPRRETVVPIAIALPAALVSGGSLTLLVLRFGRAVMWRVQAFL